MLVRLSAACLLVWAWAAASAGAPEGMALIAGGAFTRGCDEVDDQHMGRPQSVELDAFWMDKTEVTNAMFESVFPEHRARRHATSACDDCPVTKVSWYEASAFCKAVGKDLPTEAQWEKAAGAENGCRYPWGGELFRSPQEARDSGLVRAGLPFEAGPSPVARYPANRYGLYDMIGNVWEWTRDWAAAYDRSSPRNPEGPSSGIRKIRRGGAWSDELRGLIPAWRDWSRADTPYYTDVGFRCAKNADEAPLSAFPREQ
ncbi:MAG: SUMF1/EgtB/PvdO family nonheme iron enzyme [Elusimicrobiota bacterium]